jgi:putative peptidoglycan lipid II flippase
MKLLLAAGVAAALGWGAARACADALDTGTWPTALTLTAGTAVMALVYLGLARLLKITELRSLPGLR